MNWHRPKSVLEWLFLLNPAVLAMISATAFESAHWPGNPRLEGGTLGNYSWAYLGVLNAASLALAIWLTRGLGTPLRRLEKTIGLAVAISLVNTTVAFAGCAVAGISASR